MPAGWGWGRGCRRRSWKPPRPATWPTTEWDALGEDWLEQALAYAAVPCKGARGPLTRIRPRPARPAAGTARASCPPGQPDRRRAGVPAGGLPGPARPGPAGAARSPRRSSGPRRPPAPRPPIRPGSAMPRTPAACTGTPPSCTRTPPQPATAAPSSTSSILRTACAPMAAPRTGPPPTPPSTTRRAWPACWAALRAAGAHEQAAALLARDPAAHAALDDPGGVAVLLGQPAGRRARTSRPPRCWPGTRPPTPPSTTRTAWPACWAACGRRARTSRPPRCWPGTRPPTPPSTTRTAWPVLLGSLREAGAHEQAAALASRAAAHAALDDPGAVASLLGRLREAGAHEQAAALLARDPAAHAALDDPDGVALLLDRLREAGAHDQAAALAGRAAAHAALDDPHGVASLLDQPAGSGRARPGRRADRSAAAPACSGSSSSSKATGISSVSGGRPTAARPRHGAGKTWTDLAGLSNT